VDFVQSRQRRVHGGAVFVHDGLAAFAVGLGDGFFDGRDRLLARQNATQREETGLHDGVNAAAHAVFVRHLEGVDDEETQLLSEDRFLHRTR